MNSVFLRIIKCFFFQVEHSGPNPGSTLVIGLANEEDAGQYICEMATQSQFKIKHTVNIRGEEFTKLCLRVFVSNSISFLFGLVQFGKQKKVFGQKANFFVDTR